MPRSSKTLNGRERKHLVPEPRQVGALRRYGVKQEQIDKVGNITSILHRCVGGRSQVLEMLRFSEEPAAQTFLDAYLDTPIGDRNYIPFEAICIKAEVSVSLILDAAIMSAKSIMGKESALETIVQHPSVVRKTIQYAKELPGAFADRKMIHEAVGWLPTKGGANVNVHLNGGNTQFNTQINNEPEDDDDTAFDTAFPGINQQLEKWGERRRLTLESRRLEKGA